MKYRLFIPKQAVGASLVYFDLFNATGSASEIRLLTVLPIVSGEVAVTGVVGVDLFLTRTTAVGTGGTAAVNEGTSLTAASFTGHDTSQAISPSITARLTPAGGATAGAVVAWRCVSTEETNAGTYNQIHEMARNHMEDVGPLLVPENSGIRIVQGGVASVGNIGFSVILDVRPKGGS